MSILNIKILVVLASSVALVACKNKPTQHVPQESTFADTLTFNSYLQPPKMLPETPTETLEKEVFYDFVFDFMSDANFQKRRVAPPLSSTWKYDPMFIQHNVYTTIFCYREDISLVDSCDIKKAAVEIIMPDSIHFMRYDFQLHDNQWKLYRCREKAPDATQEKFIHFFRLFVTDSKYRELHIDTPFYLQMQDPNTYEQLKGYAMPSQWNDFAPIVDAQEITNIDYGQRLDDTAERFILISSIDGSVSSTLVFHRQGNRWTLKSLENN